MYATYYDYVYTQQPVYADRFQLLEDSARAEFEFAATDAVWVFVVRGAGAVQLKELRRTARWYLEHVRGSPALGSL